jgi:hypothetical protein
VEKKIEVRLTGPANHGALSKVNCFAQSPSAEMRGGFLRRALLNCMTTPGRQTRALHRPVQERLPNGATYNTLDCIDNGFYDNTNVYQVPPGALFMLGGYKITPPTAGCYHQFGYVPGEISSESPK